MARSSNPDRTVASPLQHGQAAQRLGLPTVSAQKHRPDRPKADHALTFKLDHPMGAHQVTNIRTVDTETYKVKRRHYS
jgi:hypothetical protein